ncbi:hypothetical protein JHK85_029646 [Glycine max]|nr:hypothetical protein JHK85_029646 [Glycine max]
MMILLMATTTATRKLSGFVKEVVTFMVMHDLDIQPMSTIKSNVITKDSEVGALQEKVVQLGITEGINMLKASLESNMVLTTVFLKNNTCII